MILHQPFPAKPTIREDIRVMRSDMLGFNAPIIRQVGAGVKLKWSDILNLVNA
ncbi:MAG: hypothetical protein V2B15_07435 [Bacteroidota bacterium]